MVETHPTAEVSDKAQVGSGTKVWHYVQVRENAKIGKNCILSKNVYVDLGVVIGDNVKIQNNVSIYRGTSIEDGVFVGPHACLINDKNPRAINSEGNLKSISDWQVSKTLIKNGASIGACSVILPGITIGKFAMIGAGSVVTKNVPDYGLVYGNPAKLNGFVCKCGRKIKIKKEKRDFAEMFCSVCNETIEISKKDYDKHIMNIS